MSLRHSLPSSKNSLKVSWHWTINGGQLKYVAPLGIHPGRAQIWDELSIVLPAWTFTWRTRKKQQWVINFRAPDSANYDLTLVQFIDSFRGGPRLPAGRKYALQGFTAEYKKHHLQ